MLVRREVFCFGLNYGDGKIACITKQIVGSFLLTAAYSQALYLDTAICEYILFGERMRLCFPTGLAQVGGNVDTACVGFVQTHDVPLIPAKCQGCRKKYPSADGLHNSCSVRSGVC